MNKSGNILLAHGGGGRLMHELIRDVIVPRLSNPVLDSLEDAAVIDVGRGPLAFTTDSYVVKPIFFRGGNIGRLSVCGTVNDLAVQGARPVALSLAFIIEEGFEIAKLEKIVASIAEAAEEAGVYIATGDLKVVENGGADGIFINTAGIGRVIEGTRVSSSNARQGDAVLINGPIAEHGLAIMCEREGVEFGTEIGSDCAPLAGMVGEILRAVPDVHCMKDPTRGGLAGALHEIAEKSRVTIEVHESDLPLTDATRSACDLLGLDPLSVANEGKVIVVCPGNRAQKALDAMKNHRYGREARIIGEVSGSRAEVLLRTAVGGLRIIDMPYGELLPRIC